MEKFLSLFRKRHEESDEAALANQYFTWNSPFESEADRYAVWHTDFGFDRERNLEAGQDDNAISVNIVDELPEPNGSDVTLSQPTTTQPTCGENGEVITTEAFTYSQYGIEGSAGDGEKVVIPTWTRILLIVGLVICKPFGEIMFDNYLLSIYYKHAREEEESARRLRLACIWGIVTYVSFVLYMAIIGVVIFLSVRY